MQEKTTLERYPVAREELAVGAIRPPNPVRLAYKFEGAKSLPPELTEDLDPAIVNMQPLPGAPPAPSPASPTKQLRVAPPPRPPWHPTWASASKQGAAGGLPEEPREGAEGAAGPVAAGPAVEPPPRPTTESTSGEIWGQCEVFSLGELAAEPLPRPLAWQEHKGRGSPVDVGEEEEEEGYQSARSSSFALTGSSVSLASAQLAEQAQHDLGAGAEEVEERGAATVGQQGVAPRPGGVESVAQAVAGKGAVQLPLQQQKEAAGLAVGKPSPSGSESWRIPAAKAPQGLGPGQAEEAERKEQATARAQRGAVLPQLAKHGSGRAPEVDRLEEPPPSPEGTPVTPGKLPTQLERVQGGSQSKQEALPDWLQVQQGDAAKQPPPEPEASAAAQQAQQANQLAAAAAAAPPGEQRGPQSAGEEAAVGPAAGAAADNDMGLLHRQHDIPPSLRQAAIAVLSRSPPASPRAQALAGSPRGGAAALEQVRQAQQAQQAWQTWQTRQAQQAQQATSPGISPRGAAAGGPALHRLLSPRSTWPTSPPGGQASSSPGARHPFPALPGYQPAQQPQRAQQDTTRGPATKQASALPATPPQLPPPPPPPPQQQQQQPPPQQQPPQPSSPPDASATAGPSMDATEWAAGAGAAEIQQEGEDAGSTMARVVCQPGQPAEHARHARQSSWQEEGAYGLPASYPAPGEGARAESAVIGQAVARPAAAASGAGGVPAASMPGAVTVPLLVARRRAMVDAYTGQAPQTNLPRRAPAESRGALPAPAFPARKQAQQAQQRLGQQQAAPDALAAGSRAVPMAVTTTFHGPAQGQGPLGAKVPATFPGRFVFHDEEAGLHANRAPRGESPLLERLLPADESGNESEDESVAQRAEPRSGLWPSVALQTKATLGVGIVLLPYAFSLLGLVGGSLALALLGLLAFLSAHLLIKAAHPAGAASYSQAIGALLGGWGQALADLAMAALCFGLMVATLVVTGDALIGGPGALLADWLDRPTALAAYCVVIGAPLVSIRHPGSLVGAAGMGVAAATLWAAGLMAVTLAAMAQGGLAAGTRLWPKAGGLPWWLVGTEVIGVLPVLLLAVAPHTFLLESLAAQASGNARRLSRAGKEAACGATLLYSLAALLLSGLCGYALFGADAHADAVAAWGPSSFEAALGPPLAALCCAGARLAVVLALLAGLPLLMAGFRTSLWRLLFWQELRGAGFFLVTFTALAAAAYASLHLPESTGGGQGLWRGLQLLGATAGAAVVLLVPGLAFCCGGRVARSSWEEVEGGQQPSSTADRWLGALLALAGLGVAAGAVELGLRCWPRGR